jgi:hypothetical protein
LSISNTITVSPLFSIISALTELGVGVILSEILFIKASFSMTPCIGDNAPSNTFSLRFGTFFPLGAPQIKIPPSEFSIPQTPL